MRPHCYQPSGRFPALTGLVLICCLAFAGVGALPYAWVILHEDWYLNAFFTWIFSLWLVLIVKWACHFGKIRNPGLMRQFGLIIGLAGWAFQWLFWIVFASYDSVHSMPGHSLAIPLADLVAEPGAFRQGFKLALAATDWANEDDRYSLMRYACWLAELCMLLIPPGKAGFVRAGRPFCEALNRWAEPSRLSFLFAGDTLLKAQAHLAAHPDQLLAALTVLRGTRNCHAVVTVYMTRFDTFMSIVVSELKWEGRRVTREDHLIVAYLRAPARELAALQERLSRPPRRKKNAAATGKKRPVK